MGGGHKMKEDPKSERSTILLTDLEDSVGQPPNLIVGEESGERPLLEKLQGTSQKSLPEMSLGKPLNLVKIHFPHLPRGNHYCQEERK